VLSTPIFESHTAPDKSPASLVPMKEHRSRQEAQPAGVSLPFSLVVYLSSGERAHEKSCIIWPKRERARACRRQLFGCPSIATFIHAQGATDVVGNMGTWSTGRSGLSPPHHNQEPSPPLLHAGLYLVIRTCLLRGVFIWPSCAWWSTWLSTPAISASRSGISAATRIGTVTGT